MKIVSKRGRERGGQEASDEFKKHEVEACAASPVYFINNYIYTQIPLRGPALLTLRDYQEQFVDTIFQHQNVVAVISRMAGTSTVSLACALWEALFTPDTTIVVSANSASQAIQLADILRLQISHVPAWLRPRTTRWSRSTVQLENGSKVIVTVTSPNAISGSKVSRLYFDSFAHCTDRMQFDTWLSISALIAKGTKCVIASSPNGKLNTFAQLWHNSTLYKPSLFFPFKKTVNDMKHLDPQWKAMMKVAVGESTWKREFECEF